MKCIVNDDAFSRDHWKVPCPGKLASSPGGHSRRGTRSAPDDRRFSWRPVSADGLDSKLSAPARSLQSIQLDICDLERVT